MQVRTSLFDLNVKSQVTVKLNLLDRDAIICKSSQLYSINACQVGASQVCLR